MAAHKRSKSCDLNRPLPAVPSDGTSPCSSNKDSISSSFVDTLNSRLSDCTTWSTPYIDKQTYRKLTKDILPLPATPATPSLSFQEREAYNCVDPVKYNPSESSKYSDEQVAKMLESGTSLRILGPFENNERYTRLEDMYESREQDALAKAVHDMYAGNARDAYRKPLGLPISRSEGSMLNHNTMRSPHLDDGINTRGFPHIRFANDNDPPIGPPRGHGATRTPSPVKQLEDIKEEASVSPRDLPRRSRSPVKQLFGEKGWLGRSTSMKELPSEEYRKTGIKIWGGKLKQRMIQKTEDLSKMIPSVFNVHISPSKPPKNRPETKFPVSLQPPEQAKLYSEMELMICAAANKFLLDQKEADRISFESVQKVTNFWVSKNRPQVIDFMFDQSTQRDLVADNVKTFRFCGPSAEDPISMHTMLLSWKTLAKEMSVRTFCSPDSVIKKQMHDSYKILEMLGAPMVTFLAFQELQVDALKKMHGRATYQKKIATMKPGVEYRQEIPADASPKHSGESWGNPFE